MRLEYPGAVYHVTSRGQERRAIFRDDADREDFRKALGSVARDHGWILHAYCLTGNRYDLLLETPAPNLALGMKALNGRYTQRFNRRHRRSGHLLEGRYKSILVQKESHLLELCRYVVLSPVRAGMVRRPGDWPWSSYRSTAGLAAGPSWLELDWALSQFGRRREAARREYRRFVAAGRGVESPLEKVRHQVFLGDDGFLRRMTRRIGARREDSEIPVRQR
ncbi:MAG: transposase, partial [Thermoanaerobaculia bacterium]